MCIEGVAWKYISYKYINSPVFLIIGDLNDKNTY
jgi:hypothetical protein